VAAPLRGTQSLVGQMGWVTARPLLTAIEIGWRWLFGVPFLAVCWRQAQQIVAALPPESAGLTNLNPQNPWVAAVQLSNACALYQPYMAASLRWLLPMAALAWVVVSGLGRSLVLMRLQANLEVNPVPRLPRHPLRLRILTMIVLQAAWLAVWAVLCFCWFRSMQWAAATHIAAAGEPDLVGYFIWAIVLSLGFFTAFALSSWPFSIAPLLVLLERRSAGSALRESLRLGKPFTSKLVEINLVLGIVKLALMVVAMVFSAAPLPFSDELGSGALQVVSAATIVFYFVANDFFQVVRIKAFLEFWRLLRGPKPRTTSFE